MLLERVNAYYSVLKRDVAWGAEFATEEHRKAIALLSLHQHVTQCWVENIISGPPRYSTHEREDKLPQCMYYCSLSMFHCCSLYTIFSEDINWDLKGSAFSILQCIWTKILFHINVQFWQQCSACHCLYGIKRSGLLNNWFTHRPKTGDSFSTFINLMLFSACDINLFRQKYKVVKLKACVVRLSKALINIHQKASQYIKKRISVSQSMHFLIWNMNVIGCLCACFMPAHCECYSPVVLSLNPVMGAGSCAPLPLRPHSTQTLITGDTSA